MSRVAHDLFGNLSWFLVRLDNNPIIMQSTGRCHSAYKEKYIPDFLLFIIFP